MLPADAVLRTAIVDAMLAGAERAANPPVDQQGNRLLSATPTREQIERLEQQLLLAEEAGHGVVLETWHHFADGLVARTIFIPAGTCLTGAPHKAEHLNVCHGDIEVWTENGMQRLIGHHVIPSLPGAKRAGLAHADTWWTTVHLNPGNERDIDKLEDALVEGSEQLQRRRLTNILPYGASHLEAIR